MECIHPWHIGEKRRAIIHFAFAAKPWHDVGTTYGIYFWEAAAKTPFFMDIKQSYASYTLKELEEENLVALSVAAKCLEEIARPDRFLIRCKKASKAKTYSDHWLLPLFQQFATVKA